jgi:hypothetical protein
MATESTGLWGRVNQGSELVTLVAGKTLKSAIFIFIYFSNLVSKVLY